jgi:hypothetical protein
MDKIHLLSLLDKYYLNGITEKVKIEIKNEKVNINFIVPNKDLVGTIVGDEFKLEDAEIGIYNTSQLLKLINITNNHLILNLKKENKIPTRLLIADNEFNLDYILADTMMISPVPSINEPEYDIEASIDLEFINKFIKAKKAIDSEIFLVDANYDEVGSKVIRFILGGSENYTNKVTFTLPATYEGIHTQQLQFNINYLREILDTNKDLTSGKLRICTEGLMRIDFTSEKSTSSYILVAKE